MNVKAMYSVALMAVALLVVSGPAQASSAKAARTVGDKIDDASITALVKTTLLYHRSTSGIETSVTTKDGVVTLTGKASNAAESDLASKYANDVNGVKSVNNKITIE